MAREFALGEELEVRDLVVRDIGFEAAFANAVERQLADALEDLDVRDPRINWGNVARKAVTVAGRPFAS
ncbi:hypothetical protein CC2G_013641 [Coprinopsis cinerea AmutBmut pab1-1]|nr:hypothetical protein CC2G_013641 [Coprinopsis cinerea AmutBmut pab1-1]